MYFDSLLSITCSGNMTKKTRVERIARKAASIIAVKGQLHKPRETEEKNIEIYNIVSLTVYTSLHITTPKDNRKNINLN